GVAQPARQALLSLLASRDGSDRGGDEAESEADCREDRGAEDVGDEAAADGHPAEPEEAERHEQHPRRKDRLEAEPGDKLTAQTGREDDGQSQRKAGEAGG